MCWCRPTEHNFDPLYVQFAVSGSDDFNLYMWRIPDDPEVGWVDKAHLVLAGHRSIVNQV